MDRNFNEIVNKFSEIEPPKGLKEAVFQRIEKEQLKAALRKQRFFQVGLAICGISSFVAIAIFGRAILNSEFLSLAALAFSDLKTVLAMWQDYGFSLLETLPTFSVAATLLPIFAFLMLLRQYAKFQEEDYNYGAYAFALKNS
ncbi:MAG: hypothetical protein WCF93_02465 [Candidatus Moraniibacteriota bacterium]